jgi:hypothetical protein
VALLPLWLLAAQVLLLELLSLGVLLLLLVVVA